MGDKDQQKKSHGKIVNILSKAFTIKPAFTDGC